MTISLTRIWDCLLSEATDRSPGPDASSLTLPSQAQAHLELGELLAAYSLETSVLLVGYSTSAWYIR